MPKKFKAKNGEPLNEPTSSPVATETKDQTAQAPKKTEAPKLPVKLGTKNDALGCVVVVDNNMTYFGTEDMSDRGVYHWRVTYSPDRVKKLFEKIEALNGDASLTDVVKAKKVAETFKSFTSPVPKVGWTHKLESAMPAPVAPAAEVPVAPEAPTA